MFLDNVIFYFYKGGGHPPDRTPEPQWFFVNNWGGVKSLLTNVNKKMVFLNEGFPYHLNHKRFLMAITIPSSITWLNIYNLVGGFSHRIRALYSEINAMVLHDNILAGQCTVFALRWGSLGKARMNDVRVTCLILSESCLNPVQPGDTVPCKHRPPPSSMLSLCQCM